MNISCAARVQVVKNLELVKVHCLFYGSVFHSHVVMACCILSDLLNSFAHSWHWGKWCPERRSMPIQIRPVASTAPVIGTFSSIRGNLLTSKSRKRIGSLFARAQWIASGSLQRCWSLLQHGIRPGFKNSGWRCWSFSIWMYLISWRCSNISHFPSFEARHQKMSEQRLQRSGSFALLGHPFVLGMKLCYLKWPSSTASVMDMPFSVTLQHCLMVRIDGRKNFSEPLLVLNVPQPIPRRSLSAGWTKRKRHYSEGAWATSTSKRRHVVVSCQEFMNFVALEGFTIGLSNVVDKRVCSQQRPWNARYHRNMVGLMPTWEHMLHNRLLEDYESQLNATWLFWSFSDLCRTTPQSTNVQCLFEIEDWVINSEWETWQTAQQEQHGTWQQLQLFMCQQRLDHFLSPSRARLTIVSGSTVSHDIVRWDAVQFNYQLQAYRCTWVIFG